MAPLIIKTTGFEDYLAGMGGSYIKCLMFGSADAGKTRSASFWPKPIFADCEDGRMSIADRAVPYASIKSSADMDALLLMVKMECGKPAGQRRFETLVIDTIDSFQRTVISERLFAEKKVALSGWQDWGYLDARMTNLIEKVMSLPMNVVVNCHVKDETFGGEDEDKSIAKKAKLKGDIREQIVNDFDLIGHLETYYIGEDGKRVRKRHIRWHADPFYPLLKDRSGRLPQYTDIDFTEDDFYRIYNAIVGEFLDDLPEATEIETLEVAAPVAAAPPDVTGGPVEVGKLPTKRAATSQSKAGQASAAARKKAAADQKAADKEGIAKAAAAVAEKGGDVAIEEKPDATTESTDGPVQVDEQQVSTDVVDSAAAKVQAGLGGEVVADTKPPVPPAAPAPADVADEDEPSEPSDSNVEKCGDQPAGLAGKFAPASGTGTDGHTFPCGKSLAAEPRDRVNIAVLRTKTLLCSECFSAWKSTS